MIRIYSTKQAFYVVADPEMMTLEGSIWFDLLNPDAEEERALELLLGIDLPTKDEMQDIEISSRLYSENGASYMTATLLYKADSDEPETTNVGFVLTNNRLVTIRYAEPKPFNAFLNYADKHNESCADGAATMVGLLEAIVDRNAEVLERTGGAVDMISKQIFSKKQGAKQRRQGEELERALTEVAFSQNLTAKARDSLVSLGRLVGFLALSAEIKKSPDLQAHLVSISRDIQVLNDHASFLGSNISFLLDASLGLISVEQNAIIKIFSIAAVVLLPPTLIASIYGMNFAHMPELAWHWGYPMALVMMVISGIVPYVWFKHRGWL